MTPATHSETVARIFDAVLVTRRPKYACRACQEAIVQAPAPARLIEGGLPTERMVAHVLVAKYADHTPLYRQCQILARQGIEIDRATLAFWVGYAAAEVKPLWRLRSTPSSSDEAGSPVHGHAPQGADQAPLTLPLTR